MNATQETATTRNVNLLTRDGVANVIASNPDLQALQAQVEALQAQLVAKANETVATHVTVRGIELSVQDAKWELQALISKGKTVTDKANKAILVEVAKADYVAAAAKQAEKELLVNINETGECLLEPVDALLYTDIAEELKHAGLSLQRQAIWATEQRPKTFDSKF